MRFLVNQDTILEETGDIIIRNYPPREGTYTYLVQTFYKHELINGKPTTDIIDGPAIYMESLTPDQIILAEIMGKCTNQLFKVARSKNKWKEYKSPNK